MSEVYYKPGWKAFVNGVETKIYQTNHILRSVYIPSGESDVLFEYDDSRWQNTRMLSRISILTVLVLIGFSILIERKQKSN